MTDTAAPAFQFDQTEPAFAPGALVRLRGREWVVQPNEDTDTLRLRPLGGTDDDIQLVVPELELPPPESATFPLPDPSRPGSYCSALLLRDALRLKLRSGAGPFRSFARIAVEPRAYQLVPLLMALKQETVRLLIADDVGIGKTIEAGLIARELLDRGEIHRIAVLCPPHLVEQWQSELRERFHIDAKAVTSSSVARLEREVPPGSTLFTHFKAVVVSLDYIKIDTHRQHFLSGCPEFIIVDEAHTCTIAGKGRQLRYQLLKSLAEDERRHLVMLTATPHSGDDTAFGNLLSLLKPAFAELSGGAGADGNERDAAAHKALRSELAGYFVQRRRKDIEEWKDDSVFPRRMVHDATYSLSGEWGRFFEDVRAYCLGIAESAEREKGEKARMMWYATLALLRCISSSPAAAVSALGTRLAGTPEEIEALADYERVEDGDGEELVSNDLEPAANLSDDAKLLSALLERAESLKGPKKDPKLARLIAELEALLKEGFRPVVFCRYIATAEYVAAELRERFGEARIDCVTGLLSSEERADRVADLTAQAGPAVLVATDCLSEGINLQDGFTAVVHYDLAWNPTRHEQREGRVDRFGQEAPEVRCVMLYGEDNPVDGFILNVILRKAKAIQKELGVLVPLPDDDRRIRLAVVKAALMKRKAVPVQNTFDFDGDEELKTIIDGVENTWQNAMEKAKANNTIFSQRSLKPDEVFPEWQRQINSLGAPEEVERFAVEALTRLGSRPESRDKAQWKVVFAALPRALRNRFEAEGLDKPMQVAFRYPAPSGIRYVHRSHALVSLLADHVLETALASGDTASERPVAARSGAFATSKVSEVTTVYLLRFRHRISSSLAASELMAEESVAVGVRGRSNPTFIPDTDMESLLDNHPEENLDPAVITRETGKSLEWFTANRALFEGVARRRADILRLDHRRVREASKARGSETVSACLPVDLIGAYVLLPAEL